MSDATLARLIKGVRLEDGMARFVSLVPAGGEGANRWYHGVVTEGRQREVRRLWQACGLTVSRLIRIRFGPITLPRNLARGRWRELSPEAIASLREAVES